MRQIHKKLISVFTILMLATTVGIVVNAKENNSGQSITVVQPNNGHYSGKTSCDGR